MLIPTWLGNAENVGRMLTRINTVDTSAFAIIKTEQITSLAAVKIGAVKFDKLPLCLPGNPAICKGTMGDVRVTR